jgi:hypothetical protein
MKFFKQSWRRWAASAMLFAGIAQGANAQTIIWGAGSSNPTTDSIGRFAGVGNDTIIATSGWIPTPVSSPIYGMWERSFTRDSRGSNSATVATRPILASPSFADGVAMFDSDFYYDASAGSAPQSGYITSPIIDLTGQTGRSLNISIQTAYLDFATTNSTIGFSIDGGTTWRSVDVRTITGQTGVRAAYNGEVLMSIRPDVATATDLDSCMIRFNFVGDSYYWAIDDVNIQTALPFDISISTTTAGNSLSDAFTTAYISNNYFQPLSQVDSADYVFGARILNSGADSITPANNAKLMLMIERETAANVWALEFNDSLDIDSVAPGARVNIVDQLAWLPTQVGRYRATYLVKQDLSDATTTNDTSRHIFNITDNDGYYSKVPLDADGGVGYTTAGFPGAAGTNLVSGFEWGSMFYFPTGASYQIDSVNFRAYIQSAGAGYTGGTISVRIAKYIDLNGDGVLDDSPTSGELVLVGLGTVDMTSVSNGFKRASAVPINTNDGGPLILSDTSIYLVSVSQDRAQGLVNATNNFFGYWYCYSADVNYGLNAAFLSAVPTPLRSAEITSAGAAATNDWNWIGFGPDQVPSIGINMSAAPTSTNRINATATHNVLLFPNPAEDVITVKVDLTAVGNIQYLMTDVTGRVVRMNTTRNAQNDMVSFNVADLAAGVYMITVKTAQGTSTERFVKK